MAIITIQNKYPDRAGYLGLNTNTNELEVFSDGKFKAVTENNEYFNIYKNSKLLFESTTDSYAGAQILTDLSNMRQYIYARKGSGHIVSPAQVSLINLMTKQETILRDGTVSPTKWYASTFVFYHNNLPYSFLLTRDVATTNPIKVEVINPLSGQTIAESPFLFYLPISYITLDNELYFGCELYIPETQTRAIVKYSPSLNTFTILNQWTIPEYKEVEPALGTINGKKFGIYRKAEGQTFGLYKFNDDWTIKEKIPLNFGYPIMETAPYIFRKGNKVLFTYITRNGLETPGLLKTYEITEKNDNFTFTLKNIYSPLLPEDTYYINKSDYIYTTGYQTPTILPFAKTGLIQVEDNRTVPSYATRYYQLDYDNDISVDYSNFV